MFKRSQKCPYCEQVVTVEADTEVAANEGLEGAFEAHMRKCSSTPEETRWVWGMHPAIPQMYLSQYGHLPQNDDAADLQGVASMKEWLEIVAPENMTPDAMFHAWAHWSIEQERNLKEQLRQMLGGQIIHIKGHEVARQSGDLGLYIVDGTPLGLETAANVISIACYESGATIPTEINEWTDLEHFDEYEAKDQGWPQELIAAAIREIQRRELDTPSLRTSDEIIMQSPEWREEDEPALHGGGPGIGQMSIPGPRMAHTAQFQAELDANIERQIDAQQEQETIPIRRTRGHAGIEWQGPGYYYSDPARRYLWVRATSLKELECYKHTMRFTEDDLI